MGGAVVFVAAVLAIVYFSLALLDRIPINAEAKRIVGIVAAVLALIFVVVWLIFGRLLHLGPVLQ
jgi:hypothetical protein